MNSEKFLNTNCNSKLYEILSNFLRKIFNESKENIWYERSEGTRDYGREYYSPVKFNRLTFGPTNSYLIFASFTFINENEDLIIKIAYDDNFITKHYEIVMVESIKSLQECLGILEDYFGVMFNDLFVL